MNYFNHSTQLTDQFERELIKQEISRQMSFKPSISLKRIIDKIASVFGYGRIDSTMDSPRSAH